MELWFPLLLQIYNPYTVRVVTARRLINSVSNLSKDLSMAKTAQQISTFFFLDDYVFCFV